MLITAAQAAVVFISLTAVLAHSNLSSCKRFANCPCGSTGKYITVCDNNVGDLCRKFSGCSECLQGVDRCLECAAGFTGPDCTEVIQKIKSRQKRQGYTYNSYEYNNENSQDMGYGYGYGSYQGYRQRPRVTEPTVCPNISGPKHGSIRCEISQSESVCIGKCLPGYTFTGEGSTDEMRLHCQQGVWSPRENFPPCISGGRCEIEVAGAGSFNCTTRMTGTVCDVRCHNQYPARFHCFPGQNWNPPLPKCVRPKGGEIPEEIRHPCKCQYGGKCEENGHCLCPVGRTGTYCETIIEDKMCDDPGFIPNGIRRNTQGTETRVSRRFRQGESVVYDCKSRDFLLKGYSFLMCSEDGTWSAKLPECVKQTVPTPAAGSNTCGDPGQVPNAKRLNTDGSSSQRIQRYNLGESVVYTCDNGFALKGESLLTCSAQGSWSQQRPSCIRIGAPTPTSIPITPPVRVSYCKDPGTILNGNRNTDILPSRNGFQQGTRIMFTCHPGYDLRGDRNIFCMVDEQWSSVLPRCVPKSRGSGDDGTSLSYCPNPGPIPNGEILYVPSINARILPAGDELEESDFPELTQLQYKCNQGYVLEGSKTLVCQSPGVWSERIPTCIRKGPRRNVKRCKSISPISNGYFQHANRISTQRNPESNSGYLAGSRLEFFCNKGYTLEGVADLTCEPSGEWSSEPPTCMNVTGNEFVYCNNPGPLSNGNVMRFMPLSIRRSGEPPLGDDAEEFPQGTKLEYSCEEDYSRQGPASITCEANGIWSETPPVCVGDCGRSLLSTTVRITNGSKTKAGEWPWVVAIYMLEGGVYRQRCAGALINSRTVLTAAHCLTTATNFTLHMGKLFRRNQDFDPFVEIRQSSRVLINPNFNNSTYDSDIGLIFFDTRVRFTDRIQPICMPTADTTAKNLMTGKVGEVTGWGLTENNRQADILLLAKLPVRTNEDCMESYRKQDMPLAINQNMFCAGYEHGNQSTCTGDSGSPLVFLDSISRLYTVEGLVSFSVRGQCGLPGRYTVFTKIFRYLPWIKRQIS